MHTSFRPAVAPPHPPPVQPHLDRTRLCELGDEAFDPKYVERREGLKQLLHTLARPKVRGTAAGAPGSAQAVDPPLLVLPVRLVVTV